MTALQTDGQTDRLDGPDSQSDGAYKFRSYVSIRVSVPHSEWSKIESDVLLDGVEYIAYPHVGSKTHVEHFHIFIPTDDSKRVDMYRKRVHRAFPDLSGGNKLVSAKFMQNFISNAVTYGSKEGTQPYTRGDWTAKLIETAPAWEHQNIGKFCTGRKPGSRPRDPDHFLLITPRNIERLTLRFRKEHGISSTDLADTLTVMYNHEYRLAEVFYRNGIQKCYFELFERACKGHAPSTSWTFQRLMRENYDHKNGQ